LKLESILCLSLITALLASPAWAGCGKWVIRDNSDYLSDPDFDQAVASSTGPAATLNPDGTARGSDKRDLADENMQSGKSDENSIQREAETGDKSILKDDPIIDLPIIDLAGEWRILLDMKMDGPEEQDRLRPLDLILVQTKDRLQGYGTLIEGGVDLPATANGFISDDSVSLNVSLAEQKKRYKLSLTAIDGGMKGTCELYEKDLLTGRGNATASRSSR